MHGLRQALLPLVLAIRKDCLKNESVNGAPQGDTYRRWVRMGIVQYWSASIYWVSSYTASAALLL